MTTSYLLDQKVEFLSNVGNQLNTFRRLFRLISPAKNSLTYLDLIGYITVNNRKLDILYLLTAMYEKISLNIFTIKPQFLANLDRCKNLNKDKLRLLDFLLYLSNLNLITSVRYETLDNTRTFKRNFDGKPDLYEIIEQLDNISYIEIGIKPDKKAQEMYSRLNDLSNIVVTVNREAIKHIPKEYLDTYKQILERSKNDPNMVQYLGKFLSKPVNMDRDKYMSYITYLTDRIHNSQRRQQTESIKDLYSFMLTYRKYTREIINRELRTKLFNILTLSTNNDLLKITSRMALVFYPDDQELIDLVYSKLPQNDIDQIISDEKLNQKIKERRKRKEQREKEISKRDLRKYYEQKGLSEDDEKIN